MGQMGQIETGGRSRLEFTRDGQDDAPAVIEVNPIS